MQNNIQIKQSNGKYFTISESKDFWLEISEELYNLLKDYNKFYN